MKDARAIYGMPGCTEQQLRHFWVWATPVGADDPRPRRFPERDFEEWLVDTGDTVTARIEHGRWIADCPGCRSGIGVWPEMDDAACMGCGRVYTVAFPSAGDIAEAEKVLNARPVELQNWFPGREDVADLKVENLAHGVPLTTGEA